MSIKRILVPILMPVAIVTYFVISGSLSPADAAGIREETLYTVHRGNLVINLIENGTLVSKNSEKLTPKMRGQCKIVSLVAEGETVEENQEVCKFDATAINKSIGETELALLTAETTLSTSKTNLELQQMDNTSKAEVAKVKSEAARMELERYRMGDGPQELRKLKIALSESEYKLEKAKKIYADSQTLLKKGYIKKTELKEHRIGFEKATVEYESSELAIELFEKYQFPITLAAKSNTYNEAKRAVQAETKRGKSQLLQKEVAVTQAEKRVGLVKQSIQKLKKDIEQLVIKAPCPGVVIYGDPRNPYYRENVKIGGVVWQGQTVMTIPDLRMMMVKLKIHEADINKVKNDQKVIISMDTYPGLVLAGKVSKVAQIAGSSSPWGSSSTVKKFLVEVLIEKKPGLKLKPGISAKAEILIDTLENALYVPIQCVFLEGKDHFCHVAVDGSPKRRKVKIGASNSTHTEVLEGLKEGEKVLLYNPNLGDKPGSQPAAGNGNSKEESKNGSKKASATADNSTGTGQK